MFTDMRMPSRLLIPIAALLLLGACGRASKSVQPQSTPVSGVAHSPAEAVRWLEWAWTNRDTSALHELFTDDYEFEFSPADTFRIEGWGRMHESTSNRHLFVGGGVLPPASSISLRFDSTLIASSDPRPGQEAKWHQMILTSLQLRVLVNDGTSQLSFEVTGHARFYLVRGDSAMTARPGGQPDSTRWFVERHDDETLPSGGLRPLSSQPTTWGRLKRLYLD